MTPKFYTAFSILQNTISAFNLKCDCKGSSVIVQFEQVLNTKNTDNDFTLWVARFLSESFGNQKFGGTKENVSELVSDYVATLAEQIIESCIANINEWFDNKPLVKEEIYRLFDVLTSYKQSKLYDIGK